MVRVGFIGAGGIAQHHMRNMQKVGGCEVAALADPCAEVLERAAALWPAAKTYRSWRRMLDGAKLDAVFICVPPFAHGAPELACLERGLHLFIEKPVAVSLATAARVERAAARSRKVVSVGYHWRYLKTVDLARKALRGRQVALATGWWTERMPGVPWWRVRRLSGGQAVEQTTHIFDLARLLLGEVKSVFAVARRGLMTDVPDYDVEDASAVTLTFDSGVVATIFSANCLDLYYKVGLEILAKGLVVEVAPDEVRFIRATSREHHRSSNDPYVDELKAFLTAVRTGRRDGVRSSYSDAVRTLAVTLAANRSMRTGRPVAL